MVIIQRCWDTDDDGVHVRDLGIVSRGCETFCLRGNNLCFRNADDVRAALAQNAYLFLIDIKAGHAELLLAEEQDQRESNITESDDANVRGAILNLGMK